MLIDQIELTNFRVYLGLNKLNLSTNTSTNISIIAGNNGFGKTSFLTSLVWCLYGKLMSDVDNKYRQEIYESGGYIKYCEKLFNRSAFGKITRDQLILIEENCFSVKITFSGVMLPSVMSESVEVKRTFNIKSNKEQVEILIDGKLNELTKEVGPEIFINDFILPKEIAKFFFFDAEKIVSLAEIKQVDEKKFLSQAYAEVLGIKKYTDLKDNLSNLRIRLREKSALKADRDKLEKLQKQLIQNDKLAEIYKQQIEEIIENLNSKRIASDKYQEKLIREGSLLTIEELKSLRERQHQVSFELQKVKSKFNELLELAPFAIAANKLVQVKLQLEHELNNSPISASLLKNKYFGIEEIFQKHNVNDLLPQSQAQQLLDAIKQSLIPSTDSQTKALLDFSPEMQNNFSAVYSNLRDAYSRSFKQIVADQKRLSSILNMVQRKLQDAESKEKDPVINAARSAKMKIDDDIVALNESLSNLRSKDFALNQENQTLNRQISEVTKRVKIEDVDLKKDDEAERLIIKLDKFIHQLKSKKKQSLEKNLLRELNSLMHKDFVYDVKVNVDGDLIDIELHDQQMRKIDKDLLSKGEQQLYATALLKALIDESHIRFPVFIDSPLQKFDKEHSKNIIKDFYPNIAGQVILLPLLQKELSEIEFQLLLPKIGNAYLINQEDKYASKFMAVPPDQLFNVYQNSLAHV